MLFKGIFLHFWDFLASSQCHNPAVDKSEKQSCVLPVTPAKHGTEECSDHWGFSPQNGEGQCPNNFLPSQTITTSVTLQLRSRPCPGEFEMWHLYLPHSSPGGVVLPLLSCTSGSEGSVSIWQLLARGGLPVPVLGLLEFCWPRSQFDSLVAQSPDQASAAGRKFGSRVEGGSVHSCDNELVLVFRVAELFPDNRSPLKNLTFVFKNLCKTRLWFYTDAFPVFCALIAVPVLPSPFPFCIMFYWSGVVSNFIWFLSQQ